MGAVPWPSPTGLYSLEGRWRSFSNLKCLAYGAWEVYTLKPVLARPLLNRRLRSSPVLLDPSFPIRAMGRGALSALSPDRGHTPLFQTSEEVFHYAPY